MGSEVPTGLEDRNCQVHLPVVLTPVYLLTRFLEYSVQKDPFSVLSGMNWGGFPEANAISPHSVVIIFLRYVKYVQSAKLKDLHSSLVEAIQESRAVHKDELTLNSDHFW